MPVSHNNSFAFNRRGVLLGGICLSSACGASPVADAPATNADGGNLQAQIDAAARIGGVVTLPPGVFRLTAPLIMRSGVTLQGSGRHYEFLPSGNRFTGTWLRYEGPANEPALRLHSVQNCSVRAIGIDCREAHSTTAIEIGSNNNPAAKSLVFEELSIFGAGLGVRWGLSNTLVPQEQCDDISFRDVVFHSCINGFLIDAMNSSDYSCISRVTFSQLSGTAFDLRAPGFMKIENCAAGTLSDDCILIRITGQSPDPVRIVGCQMEPKGRFLVAAGPNDQGQILLEANVINNPVEVDGIVRVVSCSNYINDRLRLSGFVRWRSRDDVWDGMKNASRHEPQVVKGESVQFIGSSLLDADHHYGKYLPLGFRIERDDSTVMGQVVVRAGILCPAFATGAYAVGDYARPRQDNGRAYQVVRGGTATAEPGRWADRATSGSVIFEATGSSAVLRSYGLLDLGT